MPNVDQFESVFKAAAKQVFHCLRPRIDSAIVVTDLDERGAAAVTARVARFLSVLGKDVNWLAIAGQDCQTIEQLLQAVEQHQPQLICTYRNLHSTAQWPHTLGRHVDVLTQATDVPVLLIPHPLTRDEEDATLMNTDVVMAMTNHMAGDDRLVNLAVRVTQAGGKLLLTHVEDENTFDRYMEVIGKIPTIDTASAIASIRHQLLREPREYIESCRLVLLEHGITARVEPIVMLGKRLAQYKHLIDEHDVDLLLMNTKDHDQLAMHGLAYPLAVELRDTPLLLL